MLKSVTGLDEYIKKHHKNKPVWFANTTDKTPQQVRKQVAHGGFIVVGDMVCQVKYKTMAKGKLRLTLAEKAVRDCKLIYRDLSERDALKMPYSVLDAWRTGKELSRENQQPQ